MSQEKKITFFMLVTERDCVIADYAVKSYQKIYDQHRDFGHEDFVLYIYLNCLSAKSKSEYADRWDGYPYTLVYDNAVKNIGSPYPGELIISPEGIERSRDDYAESYDELWSTELVKFKTPYVATVDADFEILNADFYFKLMDQLNNDSNLIGASSSYSPSSFLYDTYSKRNIWLQERNHTWFCIYRREAFALSKISHFYFEERSSKNEIIAYDSAAYFQHDLRTNHHRSFTCSDSGYSGSFIHFGAASKNRSLNRSNIGRYRKVFILCTNGIFKKRTKGWVGSFINKLAKRIALKLYSRYLAAYTVERSSYIFTEAEQTEKTTP